MTRATNEGTNLLWDVCLFCEGIPLRPFRPTGWLVVLEAVNDDLFIERQSTRRVILVIRMATDRLGKVVHAGRK